MRHHAPRVAGLAAAFLVSVALSADAQQGSLQIFGAVQSASGNSQRMAGQNKFDPDFGVAWLAPGTRFGTFHIELRGARRGDVLHTGRMYGSLRDLKFGGATWTVEAGDAYFSPAVTDYRFSNLFMPAVTFNGAAVSGHTKRSAVSIVAGQTTAWRSIFGNDPQGLQQAVGVARAAHHLSDKLEISARASRVRTSSLREFSYTVDASDQAGGGAKLWVTPSVQVVADASFVMYRRPGISTWQRDGSYLTGANWLHSKGWLQLNASRFSPGDFPALNNPLQDREGLFAAGEYDVMPRLRVSAGWEAFRSNLDPARSAASTHPSPEGSGTRSFGGLRVQVGSRSSVTVRGEEGGRKSRTPLFGFASDSDTGSWAAEWQAAIGNANTFVRYSGRQNVEHLNVAGSYDQRDASAQIFANVSPGSQLFGIAMVTRTDVGAGGGSTYWQAGGGTQLRLPRRELWLRAEGSAARNVDLTTGIFVPRESLGLGLNGQLSRWTTIAFNMNVDRAPSLSFTGDPWITRSTLRVVRTIPTGSVSLASNAPVTAREASRGFGTIAGSVFADWNANGAVDPGENMLEGIPLRSGPARSATGHDGHFTFANVPVGRQQVGLDPEALPIDFDPPAVTVVDVDLNRGDTRRVEFGLIPLGAIHGRVIRDANGNGKADPTEESIDGAVVVLDGGARSEQVRKGRYRFDAVRSGVHEVRLLIESLPDGAKIAGDAGVAATLGRDALTAEVSFVVAVEKRPEIRRVFPSRGGVAAAPSPTPRTATVATPERRPNSSAGTTSPPTTPEKVAGTLAEKVPATFSAERYAVQVAALKDPLRAKDLVATLKSSGMPAYLVTPPPEDPDGLYRVRIGPYASRATARKTAATLEKDRGEKLWVTKER
jgi:cell division septation protein DedD